MKKLKLPVICGPMPKKKQLSMDDYLKFVDFHLKYTFNEAANRKWKKLLAVGAPFSIRVAVILGAGLGYFIGKVE